MRFVRPPEIHILLVILLLGAGAFGQDSFTAQFKPNLQATILTGEIDVDGKLDEPGWSAAAVADGFAEVEPGDQVKPGVRSKALLTYDQSKLYIALIAWDNPGQIRASVCERDNIFSDDYFGIMLDTYGDASWGYEIFVNPFGIQGDLRMDAGGGEDIGFDLMWESKGLVTDSGYQVEIAIPFSSLRFPNKPEQEWRINFWRDRQREARYRYAWAAQNRNDPCFMCQWGTLTGIQEIKPSTNLDILPNIISSQSGELQDGGDPNSPFKNQSVEAEASLNMRYGLTSNSSAELTINPDFSQVESDATQIDVNSPFAISYAERRPFFQEGSDLFQSWIPAVHTRAVQSPKVAAKLTGKFGRTSVAYLLARDEKSPILIPLADRSGIWSGGKSTSNILRFKQTFLENSFIGGVFTDRRLDGGGSGTVMGGDISLRLFNNYTFRMQALGSRTAEPKDTSLTSGVDSLRFERDRHTLTYDGEHFWGHALYGQVDYEARVWNAYVSYEEYNPTFRTDDGFVTRNDTRTAEAFIGPYFRPNRGWLLTWMPKVVVGRQWNFAGVRNDEWLMPGVELNLTGQTYIEIEYLLSDELYRGIRFDSIRRWSGTISSKFSQEVAAEFSFTKGRSIARRLIPYPVLGQSTDLGFSLVLRPTKRFIIMPDFAYSHMNFPDDKKEIFEDYVLRTRFDYQFSREWYLRLVVEYTRGNEIDGRDSAYYSEKYLSLEPLLSYKLNPFTVFYIGSTHGYWEPNATKHLYRSSQRFFVKFQYLFRV